MVDASAGTGARRAAKTSANAPILRTGRIHRYWVHPASNSNRQRARKVSCIAGDAKANREIRSIQITSEEGTSYAP